MDLIKFKKSLINRYKKFPEFIKNINDSSKKYLLFLYLHLTDGIKIFITNKIKINKNILHIENIKCNKQYCKVLIMIYHKFIDDDEIKILEKNTNFNIIFYQEKYSDISKDEYFKDKNRRDFLIPCFLHDKTISFINNMYYNVNSSYNEKFKNFHILLGLLRQNIKTKNKLGIIITSSFTLATYNLRANKDIDLVILHPYYHLNKIRRKLVYNIAKKHNFIDPHIHNILEWKDINKYNMYNIDKMEDIKINNFYEIIFNPNYHYYFFGIKVIDITLDLKYRSIRAYPKNIADLILAKSKLKIEIPKIKPLEKKIIIENNEYSKNKFINIVLKYLKKFNCKIDFNSLINEISEITL
jgi:hypothetical protein